MKRTTEPPVITHVKRPRQNNDDAAGELVHTPAPGLPPVTTRLASLPPSATMAEIDQMIANDIIALKFIEQQIMNLHWHTRELIKTINVLIHRRNGIVNLIPRTK